jgi:CheY-like chemotaxis protein
MKSIAVLVVDDTSIMRQATAMTLRHSLGCEVDEAVDGFAAIDKIKSGTYAAVLMDCEMPRMDGLECTAQIRELEKLACRRIPIIGMSASTARDIRESCLNAGMDDYLDKSFSPEELRKVLAKWLIRSVLLVDDDKNIRTIAEMSLERDFDVYLAESGPSCLVVAECERPDVILLDVRMPGMDGPTTLIKLRENPLTAAIPVIFMSASVQTHETELYRKLDIIGLIEKPFDPMELAAQIRRLAAPQ